MIPDNLTSRHSHLRRAAILTLFICLPVRTHAAVVPFDPSRGLVEIDIVINDTIHARFGLDTGADRFYLDSSFAARFGLRRSPVAEMHTVAGVDRTTSAFPITLRSLKIADLPMQTEIAATIIDLGALSKDKRGGHPDGLLGLQILEQYYVTVDYPRQRLEIRTDEPHALAGKPYRTIPFRMAGHLILVDVTVGDRFTSSMILDYCASVTSISDSLATQLGLTPHGNGSLSTANSGITFSIPKLSIGNAATSTNVIAIVSDFTTWKAAFPNAHFDGILGGTFLNSHVITVDYRHRQIYIQYR